MTTKTYKRETAWALLVFLAALCLIPDKLEYVRILALPVFGFALGAFSLDAYAKQIK